MDLMAIRRGLMACQQNRSILPAEYQQVSYIEGTGDQYIDINNTEGDTWFYDVTAEITIPPIRSYNILFGHSLYNDATSWCLFITSSKTTIRRRNGTGSAFDAQISTSDLQGLRCRFVLNDSRAAIINAASNTVLAENNLDTSSMVRYGRVRVFRGYSNSQNYEKAVAAKLYEFMVYKRDTGALTYNCVPCYRKIDGEIGLYDIVGETFYSNSGTGTFIKGNNV